MHYINHPAGSVILDKNTDPSRFTGPIAIGVLAYVLCAYMALSTGDLLNATGLLLLIAAYWSPTLVAVTRGHRGVMSTGIVNLFFGWTFIGWVIALILAFRAHPIHVVSTNGWS